MNFREELDRKTEEVNGIIAKYLPREEGFCAEIAKAMNYSMTAGGKRLRPILMWESYRLFCGEGQVIAPFMTAMEMIHTHSLIHDDLPAIDNDEYRRGRKTTHAVFGEAMGVLSGDALLNYAYEVAFHGFDLEKDNKNLPLAYQILAAKTGIYGMLGGQSVDVGNDGKPMEEDMLRYIYENKTSALIEASLMIGAVLAGAENPKIKVMEQIGRKVGLAFQIQDDILDVISTTEELGKPVHSDEKNNKKTYVTLYGLKQSKKMVEELSKDAIELLEDLPEKNEFLKELLLSLITRSK